jgi:FG-GAP repeat
VHFRQITRGFIIVTAAAMCGAALVAAPSAYAARSTGSPSSGDGGWSAVPEAARATIVAKLAAGGASPVAGLLRQSALTSKTPQPTQRLGVSIAISGNTIVVGAYEHNVGAATEQGAVYVFTRPNSGWTDVTQTAVLTASDGAADDDLGYAVAISGRTIVASAVQHKVGSDNHQGALYVFNEPAKGWTTTSHFAAQLTTRNGAAGDAFGQTVAMYGNTIVSGNATLTVDGNANQGEAFVFVKPPDGWTSGTETADLTAAGGASGDRFGWSVAISGSTIVIGAEGVDTFAGRAYVFVKPTATTWTTATQTGELSPPNGATTVQVFGTAVAIDGATIVIGASAEKVGANSRQGQVFVFAKPTAGWAAAVAHLPSATLTVSNGHASDQFGDRVAIVGDVIAATSILTSDDGNVDEGTLYRFVRKGPTWTPSAIQTAFRPAGLNANAMFGQSLGMTSTAIAVGTPSGAQPGENGAVRVFAPTGPRLTKVKQTHSSWQLGKRTVTINPKRASKGGTVFSFRLNSSAAVTLAFVERVRGHAKQVGTLRVSGRPGDTKVAFDGRISADHKLAKGKCAVAITATNAAGSTAATTLHFTVR